MATKFFSVNSLLWLALALALTGSLKHLAAIFASVDGNTLMGWVQAIAIDAGLFALAYSLKQRKSDKRTTKPLWFGVILFSVISIYGNLTYGLMSTSETLPVWIETIKPYVLAGSLPILVLFLSELLSDNRQHTIAAQEKKAKRQAKQETVAPLVPSLDKANEIRQGKIEQRRDKVLTLLDSGLDKSQIANELNVSVKTVARDIKSLNGQVAQ